VFDIRHRGCHLKRHQVDQISILVFLRSFLNLPNGHNASLTQAGRSRHQLHRLYYSRKHESYTNGSRATLDFQSGRSITLCPRPQPPRGWVLQRYATGLEGISGLVSISHMVRISRQASPLQFSCAFIHHYLPNLPHPLLFDHLRPPAQIRIAAPHLPRHPLSACTKMPSTLPLRALSALRIAVGFSSLLLPRQSSLLFGVPLSTAGSEALLYGRLFGIRDLVIGAYLWKRLNALELARSNTANIKAQDGVTKPLINDATSSPVSVHHAEENVGAALWLGLIVDLTDIGSVAITQLSGSPISLLGEISLGGGAAVFSGLAGWWLINARRG
jgi:hypothetical protein